MAKYDITYSCGHTETVQLYGKYADRERYIAWASEHKTCSACRKADREAEKAAAAERAKANGMVEGSDKQLAWACDIIETAAKKVDGHAVCVALQAAHADKVAKLLAKGREEARAAVEKAIEDANAKAWKCTAHDIIDRRDRLEKILVNTAVKVLVEAL